MNKPSFKFSVAGIALLSVPLIALAANDINLTSDTNFDLLTSDTAAATTIIGENGGLVTTLEVETSYIDVTLDNASDITFNNGGSNFLKVTTQSGSGFTVTPSCPTTQVKLTSTANAVLRVEVTATDNCSYPECNDGVDNDGDGFTDYPDDLHCTDANDNNETYESSDGGGGGKSAPSSPPLDSNTSTSNISSDIEGTINKSYIYSRPLQLSEEMISENEVSGEKSAELTGDAEITIKPNPESSIAATIPADTKVTGNAEWDGKISPPIIKGTTMISKGGEPIKGKDAELARDDVDVIVEIGSENNVTLSFSNSVLLEIPVDLPDGTSVRILFSQDGTTWEDFGTAIVIDGIVQVVTDHFSYFVVSETLASELGEGPVMSTFTKKAVTGFEDVSGHWAENYIKEIYDLGIVNGKSESHFAPNDKITRAELTKIAVNTFGYNLPSTVTVASFDDVDISSWYAPYIQVAKESSLVQGWGNGSFSPNAPISRAAALKILIEAAGFETTEGVSTTFSDVPASEWFTKYVAYAEEKGIVGGYSDSKFKPGNNITRAEVAKVTSIILELKK